MGLYVALYGLSYEKFFASYTVIFSFLLFLYLIFSSFSLNKRDVFKFLMISALWFYSVATVLPVEKIILNTNIILSERPNSRVELTQLDMLSSDVLKQVDRDFDHSDEWQEWIDLRKKQMEDRKWYETNLSLELNKIRW